jgi:hypothetical protein
VIKDINEFNTMFDWDIIFLGGRFNDNFIPTNLKNDRYFSQKYNGFYKREDVLPSVTEICQYNPSMYHRTTHCYIVKKANVEQIIDIIQLNFIKRTTPDKEIDNIFNNYSHMILTFDYFPHMFFSTGKDSESDIASNKMKVRFG